MKGNTVYKRRSCFGTICKWIAILFFAWLLMHWVTGGQSEIIKGPPETPDGSYCPCPTK